MIVAHLDLDAFYAGVEELENPELRTQPLVVVPPGREAAFLAPLPVRRLPGVGPKAEERLCTAGVENVGDLAALTDEALRRLLPGSVGTMVRDRARGIDPRELELDIERISISVENTFERDIADRERLRIEKSE